MAFDIDKTLDDMIDAFAGVITGEWSQVKSCAKRALDDEKIALEAIAQARISGEINDDEMKSQLDDEKEVLKAALLACQVIGKVMAQKAVNAAIKVLTDAIKAAIKVAI